MATKNPCSKRVEPEAAYEVWQSFDGSWTYFVLKKYQSPATPKGEYGDVYVGTVKRGTRLFV